jgi:hypothetical protein
MVKIFLEFSEFGFGYLRVWPKRLTTNARKHEEFSDSY